MELYKTKLNTSSIEFNVKDVDTSSRVVTLYSAAFDNKDRDGDVIVKGAFKKTIQEQGPAGIKEIWHLLYHNPDLPVTTPFEMVEDNYGLMSRVKMPDTPRGNETLAMYQNGDYKHHSIGYRVVKKQKRSDYMELQELGLREHSTVLWAANPAATVVSVKSLFPTQKLISDEIALTCKNLRNGKYMDETFALLELKLLQLIQAAADLSPTVAETTLQPEDIKEATQDRVIKLNSLINIFK